MPTEIITITVQPGRREEFFAKVSEVGPAYLTQPGVLSSQFFTQVDDEDVVLGIIQWESADALGAAVSSEAGQAFLGGVGPLMAGAPVMRLGEPA